MKKVFCGNKKCYFTVSCNFVPPVKKKFFRS